MSDTTVPEVKPVKTQQACMMQFVRNPKKQYLYIKVAPELEKLLQNAEVETSARYFDIVGKGLQYYKLMPKVQKMQDAYNNSGYRRNNRVDMTIYGTTLYTDDGRINFSLLRTKGIAKGIKINLEDLILEDEVKGWMGELGYFLKFLYTNFVNKVDVKSTISWEL